MLTLIRANKSRGGGHLSDNDYDARDGDREVLSLCGSDPSVIWWWSYDDVRNWRDRRLLR